MKNILILIFIFGSSQSLTTKKDATNNTPIDFRKPVEDSVDINGKNETIPPIIDVTDNVPPQPPSTPTPSNNTTVSPNSTTTTPTPTTSTTLKPTTPTTPPTPKPTNGTTTETPTTKPTTSTEKTTTSVKPTPAPPSPTPTPGPSTTSKPIEPTTAVPDHHRRFDGPSFIGGIVLALGLVAIGFVAFKFYKARTELNYHTL